MRIALVLTQLEPAGAQRVALDIAEGLRARGHVVRTWFLYRKAGAFEGAREVAVVSERRPANPSAFLTLLRSLRRELLEFAPDATIGFTHYANVIASLVAASLGVRRRLVSQQNPASSYPLVIRALDMICGATGAYTKNIAVSAFVYDSFRHYPNSYRKRLSVVHNGSKVRDSNVSRNAARAHFGVPDDEFLVVAIGRLAPQKNHEVLVRALRHTNGASLWIAGEGELRDHLHKLASSLGVTGRVRLLGAIPVGDVPVLMKAADVFAMPSRFEGLSLALVEALGAGLPIVSSNIPAQQEVLGGDDGENAGLLLDCDDAESWAQAFDELAADEALRLDLLRRAARRATRFSIDETVARYEQAILAET